MSVDRLLVRLANLGVRLEVAAGRIRIDAPVGVANVELREELAACKVALINTLQLRSPGELLADLSLQFRGHPDHGRILDEFCERAREIHFRDPGSVRRSAMRAHDELLVEYGLGEANHTSEASVK